MNPMTKTFLTMDSIYFLILLFLGFPLFKRIFALPQLSSDNYAIKDIGKFNTWRRIQRASTMWFLVAWILYLLSTIINVIIILWINNNMDELSQMILYNKNYKSPLLQLISFLGLLPFLIAALLETRAYAEKKELGIKWPIRKMK